MAAWQTDLSKILARYSKILAWYSTTHSYAVVMGLMAGKGTAQQQADLMVSLLHAGILNRLLT